MAEKFVIKGGKPLKGVVEVRGAKNAAFPVLAATLLTKEPCIVNNLPRVEDVFKMLEILTSLGAEITWLGERKVKIRCSNINPNKLSTDLVCHFRGSILILGPLLARFGELKMPPPGGCLIGVRGIESHLDAFSQMGVDISFKKKLYHFKGKPNPKPISFLRQNQLPAIILQEFSVTATENVLLAASLIPKPNLLKIADQDYQVQELIKVLKKIGVKIEEVGINAFKIIGKRKNLKGFNHSILFDPLEAGTFIVATLAAQGKTLIKNVEFSFLELFLKRLKDFGAKFEILDPKLIQVLPSKNLKIDKIQSLPYPGIHSDLQPELGVLATQAKGPTLIHDPLFEGRLKYLEQLNKMGADIIFCDPHRAIVNGPTQLQGVEIPSLDIRAGAALVIAGLIAKGQTIINNIYQIDRGYERIEERLQKLGADIRRVKD